MSPSRIVVLICFRGVRPEKRLDLERLAAFANTLDNVVSVESIEGTLTASNRVKLADKITNSHPDRAVLVGIDAPDLRLSHQELTAMAVIDPGMVKTVILGQRWATSAIDPSSNANARTLLRMAMAKCRLLSPLILIRTKIIRRAIVLGNGLSAVAVSLELAVQGFDIDLLLIGEVMVEPTLYAFPDEHSRQDAMTKMGSIHSSPHIRLHRNCEILSVKGYAGDFEISFNGSEGNESVKGGAIVLAHEPDLVDGGLGRTSVVTNSSLRDMIDAGTTVQDVIVFIEGSFGKGSCPAQGTTASIENALIIKKRRPETQVYVLARDVDAPGVFERTYQMAQRSGVVFIRGDFSYNFLLEDQGSLSINDPVVGEIRIRPSLIVREAAFDIHSNSYLAMKLGLRSSDNGMVQGFNTRLHAGETTKEGVFVCHGLNASLLASDNISEAYAVASSVSELLSKSFLEHGAEVAFVDKEKCSACLACVRICPYDAPLIGEKGKAEIQVASCQGCGICVSLCPSKAIDQRRWTDAQLSAETMIASKGE